jgi:hypothetical protein
VPAMKNLAGAILLAAVVYGVLLCMPLILGE